MGGTFCIRCARLREALEKADAEIERLTSELEASKRQLRELTKLTDLQGDDLKRLLDLIERRGEQNQPERVSEDALQLAFMQIFEGLSNADALKKALAEAQSGAQDGASDAEEEKREKKKHTGRRQPSMEGLPIVEQRIVPPEVEACGGDGWVLIDVEVSERLAFRRARFECIRVVREKYVRTSAAGQWLMDTVAVAPLPEWVLPRLMADTSVIADIIMGKYGFMTPLHRQERMNELRGFPLARSTQCDWIEVANVLAAPVVAAMHAESVRESYCIATDATGAPVRIAGGRAYWHLFVFIADAGHIVFIPTRRHNGAAVTAMMAGFQGHLLSDAASIYNALYVLGVTPVACWAHCRRYFWKATLTEPELAHQALALIKGVFEIAAKAKRLSGAERALYRQAHAAPIVEALDGWVKQAEDKAEDGGRLQAALTYYTNQRDALQRFLTDGRLEVDNNACERELRALVMGRNNWQHFETKAGLQWFATFRSLISSCKLHDLNSYDYLEQMLRLARHWPGDNMLALSPKYWATTMAGLDDRQQQIIRPPWSRSLPQGLARDPPSTDAAMVEHPSPRTTRESTPSAR